MPQPEVFPSHAQQQAHLKRRLTAAVRLFGHTSAILLRFHGLITVGSTIDEAAYWFISFDRCAAVQLRAPAAGPLMLVSNKQAQAARVGFGDPKLGWYSFQVLYDRIASLQPDFLDEQEVRCP